VEALNTFLTITLRALVIRTYVKMDETFQEQPQKEKKNVKKALIEQLMKCREEENFPSTSSSKAA
jgi:hypothetical protein